VTRLSRLSCVVSALSLLAACATATSGPPPGRGDPSGEVVTAWNERILAVAEGEDRFLTLKGVRAAAMMHLAMHNAVNVAEPRYDVHPSEASAAPVGGNGAGPDAVAAASEAAYAVAVSQYPDRDSLFTVERAKWGRAAGPSSRTLGRAVAARVLEVRAGDGWDASPPYEWRTPTPGVYAEFAEHSGTPAGFVFGVGWARARPVMMESPSQFRSPPPPPIESSAYAAAFAEVKELGARRSPRRTRDQTHLALWWKEFVEKSHNRLARELARTEVLGLWETARLFALLNMSIYDGYVASFDAKYHYNHWRPYTAIRRAGDDGNPDTTPDVHWTNLHDHTYAFPSYPSAHGSVCAAAMTVLADTFGPDRPFIMTIPEVAAAGPLSPMVPNEPPTRRFEDFRTAAVECSVSRVYLGIHFRYDSEAGTAMGRRVGRLAVEEFLGPRSPGG
jgi:hypothetical protein